MSATEREAVHPDAVAALKKLWQDTAEIDETRWAYRASAAVLDLFDPKSVQPFGAQPLDGGYPDVDEDCEPVATRETSLRRLLPEIREETLHRLGSREQMRAALDQNPGPRPSAMQRMLDHIVRGSDLEFETLDRDALRALLVARRWFGSALPSSELPNESVVAAAFARADLMAPWMHLVADGFVNRGRQLKKLKSFIWDEAGSRPLMLYGIGGVGKSTLLAKLALDEAKTNGKRIVFVPIDLDRPNLNPHRPHTFFVEAVQQIVRQLPSMAGHGASIVQHLRELGARYAVSDGGYDYESSRSYENDYEWIQQQLIDVIDAFFGSLLASDADRALLTIDTFEEAQLEGSEAAGLLVRLFDALSEKQPRVRVVFSGRVRPDAPGLVEDQLLPGAPAILLRSLDTRSALSLLRKQLKDVDPKPTHDQLGEVVSAVGRNPMCLKLAGRIIQQDGTRAFLDDADRKKLLEHLRAEKIQAFLFGRILDHFKSKRIRPLARPGLIVRRISPDVIREVLAEPCGITLSNSLTAEDLYDDLAKERTMVEPDGTHGLRYRPDLRRELLPDLIESVGRETAREIDQRAVDHYRRFDEPRARAEEIYHLLRLGTDAKLLDARWDPRARDFLRGSAPDELEGAQRHWLARKLNITLDSASRQTASQDDWERMAVVRAERYLKRGDAEKALAALRERIDRSPGSEVYQLESEALRILGDFDGAQETALKGLEGASDEARAELLLKLSSIREAENKPDEALQFADEALTLTEHIDIGDDSMLDFRALINCIRLLRKLGDDDKRNVLRARALKLVDRKRLRQLRDFPKLFEETAAELGVENPAVLEAAVRRLGVQVRSDQQEAALVDAFHTIWQDGFEQKVQMPKALDPNLVVKIGADKQAAEEIIRQSKGAALGKFAGDLIKVASADTSSATRFRDYFRESVEQGLKRQY
ncbi:MAG: AAA family ATPase [Pseudomonadota bacterium]